jgi:hypothetical protein
MFSLATFASFLWFVVRFSKECSALPFFAAFSIPAVAALCGGQDTPFLLVILGASILLIRRNMDFAAGLILALCAIKFHLFLLLPVLLLLKKRWRILGGAGCGTIALTALGMLVDGPYSIGQYLKVLRDPWINPNASSMPNLHGLVSALHGDLRMELFLVAFVVLGFLWMTYASDNFEFLFAASLVSGLLVSFHSGIPDDLVLFPALVLLLGSSADVPLRSFAALILTPIPYLLFLPGPPYSAVLPIALLLYFGVLLTSVLRKQVESDRYTYGKILEKRNP